MSDGHCGSVPLSSPLLAALCTLSFLTRLFSLVYQHSSMKMHSHFDEETEVHPRNLSQEVKTRVDPGTTSVQLHFQIETLVSPLKSFPCINVWWKWQIFQEKARVLSSCFPSSCSTHFKMFKAAASGNSKHSFRRGKTGEHWSSWSSLTTLAAKIPWHLHFILFLFWGIGKGKKVKDLSCSQ